MDSADVVVGDVVLLKGGDRIPADIRILNASGFKVDCSSLTGESEPQVRNPQCTSKNPLETSNLALFGTNAVEGQCKGIVVGTGDRTVMGRIAMLTSRVSPGKTPIAKEITHFIWIISVIAFIIGGAFFIVSLLLQYTFLEALVFLIGIIVANVPEGITATVTDDTKTVRIRSKSMMEIADVKRKHISNERKRSELARKLCYITSVCLTLTAVRMRKKNCLVKKLEGVETLGSTSIICSDKTGTLTQNRMTVTHLWVNGGVEVALSQDRNSVLVDSGALANEKAFNGEKGSLLRCASLCSNADFVASGRSTKTSQCEARGDASEVAILRYCEAVCGDVRAYRQLYPKVCEIPFNSINKYQVSIHKTPPRSYLLVMKGAPEKILTCCSTVFINGTETKINKDVKENFKQTYEFLGGLGERVLGFCDLELDQKKYGADYKFTTETPNFPLRGLRFLGLIAMIDPPRPAVPHAVRLCKSAGIKVVMVTGDHPITAQAIARQVHIIEQDCDVTMLVNETDKIPNFDGENHGKTMRARGIVIHGERLRYLSEDQLDYIAANVEQVVFARTSPAQKLQIVETFQRAGGVVAVTGDGVNDAPALRKADIGIAMGIAGTDVSKEAADMILLDDNFASIVTGVEEGRIIFDNLKKSIAYTLTSNIPEISPFLAFVAIGLPLPLSVVAILCIDLGTDLWPAISIAYEEAESDIMKRPPRNSERDKLVNARLMNFSYLQIGVMQAASAFMTYFFIMGFHGFLPSHLIYLRKQWDNKNINDLEDSFGQQWTYQSRKELEHCCHGAFFYSIVVVQWADLIISKTRHNSLVTQGMSNMVLNGGLIFTTILASVLLFTPYVNEVFLLTPIRLEYALVSLPFAFLIFAYDEMRKFLCRKYPNGWMYHETFY
uniref:Sodium/potassium-transporting ATPase subunit alpha n=1 Tax=Parascaris univalens TaxID=6257 RepID=A0A914ZX84_PARUN